jgi:hypothetical protein
MRTGLHINFSVRRLSRWRSLRRVLAELQRSIFHYCLCAVGAVCFLEMGSAYFSLYFVSVLLFFVDVLVVRDGDVPQHFRRPILDSTDSQFSFVVW